MNAGIESLKFEIFNLKFLKKREYIKIVQKFGQDEKLRNGNYSV